MQLPAYGILFCGKAVKAVRTPDGGSAFLVYLPEKGEFEPVTTGEIVSQFLFGEETDRVSEEEFEAFLAKQRAEAEANKRDPVCDA